MNTDIDEGNCIVVETKGIEIGKHSARLAESENLADTGASASSSKVEKRAVDGAGGRTKVTGQRAKGNSRDGT
jgi:hypothetical protein